MNECKPPPLITLCTFIVAFVHVNVSPLVPAQVEFESKTWKHIITY